MTLNEIEKAQFDIDQSRAGRPDLKADIQARMSSWAAKSRCCGIIQNSRFFHKGV